MPRYDVLVIGAGPAGLATAIQLTRHGVRPLVVDRRTAIDDAPKATVLSTRTMEHLRSWGLAEQTDAVLLVVSELVTNALVHTEGQVRLDLTLINSRLRVAVADTSPRSPVKPTSIGWEATGGRGILLVEAMSAAWGTVPVSGGKQVWSEIQLSDR